MPKKPKQLPYVVTVINNIVYINGSAMYTIDPYG